MFLRTVKALKFYLNCKLTNWLAKVPRRLAEAMRLLSPRQELYCSWHNREYKLHVSTIFPFPQGPQRCCRVTQVVAMAQIHNMFRKSLICKGLLANMPNIWTVRNHSFYYLGQETNLTFAPGGYTSSVFQSNLTWKIDIHKHSLKR